DYTVSYDASTPGGALVVENTILAGGSITIKGQIYSTSKASLQAFGYYGSAVITNNTNLTLVMKNVDVSQPGAGLIDITDFNQKTVQNGTTYVLEKIYKSEPGQQMDVNTSWINPNNPLDKILGGVQHVASTTNTFTLAPDLRYNFQV